MGNPLTETGFHRAIKPTNKKIEKTTLLLQGPEGEPQKGMIVRMDRLERISKQLVFFSCGMCGLGFTVLAGLIVKWLTAQ